MRFNQIIATIVMALTAITASAQFRTDDNSYSGLFDSERVSAFKEHVSYISATDKEGRKAGSEGERLAAAYLHDQLKKAGVDMLTTEEGSIFGIAEGDTLTSRNIYGFIQGYDSSLRDRYIVVGARMDNLGVEPITIDGRNAEQIYYGANGNASGMAMMIELAKMISTNSILFRRSIIFVGFGASCKGMAGSWYFLNRDFKDYGNIDAMVNLDMLGTGYEGFYAYTASNNDLNTLVNSLTGSLQPISPELVTAEPYPSDHRAFYDKEIPSAWFTTGKYTQHNTSRDTGAIIDYDIMERELEYIYNFTLSLANLDQNPSFRNVIRVEKSQKEDTVPYFECDFKPMFQNSPDIGQFMKLWVYQYLKYPQAAVERGIQGTVHVNFIVGKDGKVRNATIVRSAGQILDDEALKVISASPKWRPGRVDGVKVNASITVPVEFKLTRKGNSGFGINGKRLK